MSDTDFWSDLERRFRALQPRDPKEDLVAQWISTKWDESGRQWFISGGSSRRTRTNFEWLAKRGVIGTGKRGGADDLSRWLNLLKRDSPHFLVDGNVASWPHGKLKQNETGRIERVCEASADYCVKLANDREDRLVRTTKGPAVAYARRKNTTIGGVSAQLYKALFPALHESGESSDRDSVQSQSARRPIATTDMPPVQVPGFPRSFSIPAQQKRIPKRRVPEAAADFDRIVGEWMHNAHSKLQTLPRKGRSTPDLPTTQFAAILRRADRTTKQNKPRFPLKEVLSRAVLKPISEHNQRRGKGGGITNWQMAFSCPKFKRNIRYRFNRAEIYYRENYLERV
jgi:hypothetical protein